MSQMVKRVATAIAIADGQNVMWPAYVDHARAAIEAMREPTEAMINIPLPADYVDIWPAMIEQALR